jgi:hypothetical protein
VNKANGHPVDWWPYPAQTVSAVRDELLRFAEACHLPEADDEMLRQVLDACQNADAGVINRTLVHLFRRGRFREIKSWGLVPVVLKRCFRVPVVKSGIIRGAT